MYLLIGIDAVPSSVSSTSSTLGTNQEVFSIDVVLFNRQPFLHIIDDRTKWPEVGLLRTRSIYDQIDIMRCIQFHRHGIISVVRGDQEYNKSKFLNS